MTNSTTTDESFHSFESSTSSSSSSSSSPTIGPAYWELRRAAWLNGTYDPSSSTIITASSSSASQSRTTQASGSASTSSAASGRERLENVLSVPGVEEDQKVWDGYLGNVHKNLINGQRLRKGLKLSLVVKILRAGWIRDGTWAEAAGTSAMPTDGRGSLMTSPRPSTSTSISAISSRFAQIAMPGGGVCSSNVRPQSPWLGRIADRILVRARIKKSANQSSELASMKEPPAEDPSRRASVGVGRS
ncbi:hypothetical protein FRC03_005986 [Tulasnella sp. 419]|nr:hypothetical protein FRC03_005986 [Tulasnella sp. 419]